MALGIDGLKEQHDKIRQKPGSWDIVIDTARQLQAMKREYPRLDVQTCTCFMNSNQDTIFEWYDFLKYELKPDKVNFNYIRPPAADSKELEIDGARYARLAARIDEDSRSGAIKNHYAGDIGFFKAALDVYMHGLIAKTQETQQAQLTCYAGTAGGVIYDEGTVSSCENLEPVGNLRDYGWNFQKLWFSPAMQARRKKAADGCFCTHESNCYYPSLPFNPKHLIQIKKLEREMKKAWKGMDHAESADGWHSEVNLLSNRINGSSKTRMAIRFFVAPASRRRFCEMWSMEKSPARCRRHNPTVQCRGTKGTTNRVAETQVLIVGAGPVGLTLALDLGRRGVRCTLIERNTTSIQLPKMERCNARTMEIYRRLGIAEQRARCRPAARCADGCFSGALHGGPSPRSFAVPIRSGSHRRDRRAQ